MRKERAGKEDAISFGKKTLKIFGLTETDDAYLVGDGKEAQYGEDHDDVAEDLEGNHAFVDATGGSSQSPLAAVTLGHQECKVGEMIALTDRLSIVADIGNNLDG